MGPRATAARGGVHAGDGEADRGVRAGEPGGVRRKMGGGGRRRGGEEQGGEHERQGRLGGSGLNVSPTTTATSSSSSAAKLLTSAESFLNEGRASEALPLALQALTTHLQSTSTPNSNSHNHPNTSNPTALPFLTLIAETYLALGDPSAARSYFLQAVSLDPSGRIPDSRGGSAADKFLQLAQLSPEGGEDSVAWFTRGADILRREIGTLGDSDGDEQEGVDKLEEETEHREEKEAESEKRKKLASALCGMIEVYMTDLSWEPSAESQCESLITEALLVAPRCAEPLQTLASIRISQGRFEEARGALRDSMAVWMGVEDDDSDDDHEDEDDDVDGDGGNGEGSVPEFATRISLTRLLMEVGMEEEAVGVVERLVMEDDGSVEAWYLGGWGLYLLGVKQREKQKRKERNGMASGNDGMEGVNGDGEGVSMNGPNGEENEEEKEDLSTHSLLSSREWLRQSLKLYSMLDYEDERLKEHAMELVQELDSIIGEKGVDEADDAEEEEWNGFSEDGDKEDDEEEEAEDEDEEMDEG